MGIFQKLCRHCGESKSIDQFYKHAQMLDGHLNVCRACICKSVRERRETSEEVREYDRNRSKLPHRKDMSRRLVKQYRADNKERYKANTAVGNAIRDGRLERKPCYFCASTKNIHAHHSDYSKPLEVTWLCVKCHRRLHAIAPEHVHG